MPNAFARQIELSVAEEVRGEPPTNPWEAFALATLIRDTLVLHRAENAGGFTLTGNTQEAVLLGLDRLITLARSFAETLPLGYPGDRSPVTTSG